MLVGPFRTVMPYIRTHGWVRWAPSIDRFLSNWQNNIGQSVISNEQTVFVTEILALH